MDDNKLIKKCQIGDKEAFQELISKYHPFVYKFLIKIAENEEVAEDITQEAFFKDYKNIEKFDVYGKAKFSTYIITISKNCYIDYLRKEKFLHNAAMDENINIEDINVNIENLVINKIYSEAIIKELKIYQKDKN